MQQPDFYLELSGTPSELGRAHGEALRPVIQSAVAKWQTWLEAMSGMPFAELMAGFLKQTNYKPTIEQWAPHLMEEVRGIAEGAQMDEEVIYVWQMVDEMIDYIVEYVYVEKCSTVGGYEQTPVLGKTQDLPHCYIGAGVLIRTRYADSDVDILNATVAGIITQDGMSRHLGSCCNHIGQLDRDQNGLPVPFVVRLLFERCENITQAESLLKEMNHASGMNYGLVDKDAVRTFEVSANDVAEYLPAAELKRIWHTNHPVSNDQYCRNIAMWNALPDADCGNTQARFDFLQREMTMPEKVFDVTRAKTILSSREVPVSSQAEDTFPTINSVVMEFSDQPTLHFSPGPPSQHDYVTFCFD